MSLWVDSYFVHLAITLLSEAPCVYLAFRGSTPWRRILMVFVSINLATHGTLWWCWPSLGGSYLPKLLVAEGCITLIEAAAYAFFLRLSPPKALTGSLLANVVSTLLGLALAALR